MTDHIIRIHYSTEDMVNLATAIRLCEMNLGHKFSNMEDFFNTAVNEYIEQHAYMEDESTAPVDALIKDRLDSLRCHDCPHFGKGESKSSILTTEAYYYCQHTGIWVAWGSSCDYVKQIFSKEVTSE